MNKYLKNFITSFFICLVLIYWTVFLLKSYDISWNSIIWLKNNLYYIIFIVSSILLSWTFYQNKNKNKLFVFSVVAINILVFIFYILLKNNIQNIYLISLFILFLIGVVWILTKSFVWNIFSWISVIWILFIFLISIIPLYEQWPNINQFNDVFGNKLITYSKVNIKKEKASVLLDKEEYELFNWFNLYNLKVNKSWSLLLFKSDKNYQNTYVYLLFSGINTVQIMPQSAIKIYPNNNIEIITWDVFYFNDVVFSWDINSKWTIYQNQINEISNLYENKLKEYLKKEVWSLFFENQNILKTSNFILKNLSKIYPKKFSQNYQNFKDFLYYLDIELEQENKDFEINKETQNLFLKKIIDSSKNNQIIK